MRLTRKNEAFLGGYQPLGDYTDLCSKFGPLEDIEEALGVDLIIYLKMCVIRTSIFVLDKTLNEVLEMTYHPKLIYNPDLKAFGFFAPPDGDFLPRFPMSEYGKTWAFTKEELE